MKTASIMILVGAFLLSGSVLPVSAQSENREARRLCIKKTDEWNRDCRRECGEMANPNYKKCGLTNFSCQRYWLDRRQECREVCKNGRSERFRACHNVYPRSNDL